MENWAIYFKLIFAGTLIKHIYLTNANRSDFILNNNSTLFAVIAPVLNECSGTMRADVIINVRDIWK